MEVKFKNGSYIKVIDTAQNKRGNNHEFDMSDIDWFCNFYGIDLLPYQRFHLWLTRRKEIHKMRFKIEAMKECGDYLNESLHKK